MAEKTSNTFLALIPELRGGDCERELHSKLAELVGQVRAMAKPGELVLKLKILPPSKSGSPSISVVDEIVIKPPKQGVEVTTFYADDKNQLSRRDPRQPKLEGLTEVKPFRAVAGGVDLSKVDMGTGEINE